MNDIAAIFMAAVLPVAEPDMPRIICDNAATWTFDSTTAERGKGVREFRVSMKSSVPAVPPKFRLSFTVPQDGEHHVWVADIGSHAGIRAEWMGLYESSLARSLPLACTKDCADRNRLTVAASEALRLVAHIQNSAPSTSS